jgi:hypothetical protein
MIRILFALLAVSCCLGGGREPSYEEVAAHCGGPFSRQPVISVKAHPEVVWVRPDMAVQMVANPFSFAVGDMPRQIEWRRVTRTLEKGYLPVVESRWRDDDLEYTQTAFATLLDGGEVKTGREKQIVMVRMTVANTAYRGTRAATLWAFVPGIARARGDLLPRLDHYGLFDVTGELPKIGGQSVPSPDRVLRDGAVELGAYDYDEGVRATAFAGAIRFAMDLRQGQSLSMRFLVSSNKRGLNGADIGRLRALDFRAAHDRRVAAMDEFLRRGTRIEVPEQVVNNVFKAQILYNQTAMVQAADRDYYVPVQGYVGVWPWEAVQMLTPLDMLGYHEDTARSYGYFFKTQSRHRPQGEVKSAEGVFLQTGAFEESGWEHDGDSTLYGPSQDSWRKYPNFPRWINSTGSVLYGIGEHYFYSGDAAWLRNVAPQVVLAADWIIRERQATKVRDAQGNKVAHFGLMPAGKPYDVYDNIDKQGSYSYCFTDGWSWLGLQRAAEALADIGHPDGRRLLREAQDYRADILEVMRRVRRTDPSLPPYPERVYGSDGWGSFNTSGLSLLQTGLLSPRDPAFEQIESYSKQHYGWLGLHGFIKAKEAQMHDIRQVYTVTSDDIFHAAWLARGEVEKALLTFYSVLAYGVDRETLGSVERFSPDDRRFTPFFMNGSASSRICAMIRKTVLLEEGGTMRLLAGAPRRWLEPGKRIEVVNATTYFGKADFRLVREQDAVRATLRLTRTHPDRLKHISMRVPHPDRAAIKSVTLNGAPWRAVDTDREVVELPAGRDHYDVVIRY